jgi:hypothetical protein
MDAGLRFEAVVDIVNGEEPKLRSGSSNVTL